MQVTRVSLVAEDKPSPADALERMVQLKHKPSKTSGGSKAARQRANEQADQMRESSDWSRATPKNIVALYCWCHEHVYGVRPGELNNAKSWLAACAMAKRLATNEFDGDLTKLVGFLRWTWAREKRTEKWRRSHLDGGGRRMRWRLQFSRDLVTDFRIFLRRNTGKR